MSAINDQESVAFPDELMIEILSLLPTTSLARFQCVSKAWNSFISHVCSLQRRILCPPLAGFFIYPDSGRYYASVTSHHLHHQLFAHRGHVLGSNVMFKISHSCNGMLLLSSTILSSIIYYVWNPATMEAVALPERGLLPEPWRKSLSYCFLAFNPRKSPHYRVVRFIDNNSSTRIVVEVYSSAQGTWLDDERFSGPRHYPTNSLHHWEPGSVFHQDALYMIAGSDHLVSFDIEKKQFQHIMLPSSGLTACIGESSDQLYAANSVRWSELHIYMLLNENNISYKWVLIHKMNTEFLNHHPLTRNPKSRVPCSYYLKPIAFHPELKIIYLSMPGKILSYHYSSSKLEEVCKFSDCQTEVRWEEVFAVIPCLESVNPPGGTFVEPFTLESITRNMRGVFSLSKTGFLDKTRW